MCVAIAWLSSAILVAVIGQQVSVYALDTELSEFLASYFLITLEEPMFSDDTGVVNDRDSIANVGRKINDAIGAMIERPWFSDTRGCRAAVQRIDSVEIDSDLRLTHQLLFELPRNRIVRPVEVAIACEYRAWPYVAWAAVLAVAFYFLYVRTAYPLSGNRLRWMNELVVQGYDRRDAYEICGNAREESWSLGTSQRFCLEALHNPTSRNFAYSMRVARDPRIAQLSRGQVEWLVWGLQRNPDDLETAMKIANAPDIVEIDLSQGELRIHGVDIPVNRTPLFYYAWYANNRRLADGWVANPQSNKPDKSAGADLAQLMWSCAGHAKAAASVEEAGLKAKTLDQNRSKIKQEIVAVLGESVGSRYLFDERKDMKTGRMSYRLRVPPECVRIRLS